MIIIFSLTSCSTTDFTGRVKIHQDSLLTSISNMKLMKSLSLLDNESSKLIDKKFKNVLDKKIVASSGDKKDYTSRAIYYWPKNDLNKITSENNEWVYIDGKINKSSLIDTDHNNYYEMLDAVKKMSLSYYFFNKQEYAEKASNLIHEWFIDEATRMNPHFNYAQAIPGKNEGTPSGIIDSRGILWVIDAVDLIQSSNFWSDASDLKFRNWCKELFDWLLKSDFGKREAASKNNHGTFYDLQIIKLATFLKEYDTAEDFIDSVKVNRISKQIKPTGFQPEEMKRTKSHMYAVFNLSALLEIASIATVYDQDLWSYKTASSGSIKDAVDYLLSTTDSKNNSDKINLMRILPKANKFANGKYLNELNKLKETFDHFDLTQLYFVN